MLPSILSLAFPIENPSLYRTGGAMVPVFLLAAAALNGLMTSFETQMERQGKFIASSIATVLLLITAAQGYDLVFNQYQEQYRLGAWNTSEMAEVVREFEESSGIVENVWIMGYPYWVDTRLVSIQTGHPLRDFALFVDDLDKIPSTTEAKLFFIKPEDANAIQELEQIFPLGVMSLHSSSSPGKDFLIFYVPPES